ncbi:hypothetical protein BpHYR1_002478 [Brachionus plicatilis]|uniref:Uncharacterized protein n=1 Tax=Brachionus plicatilis TaxID=10195 RepID=A0A3M7QH30_BRAPC|nr:hypothetical protein BpHYR1_002478 [Brachionus plicatilis]
MYKLVLIFNVTCTFPFLDSSSTIPQLFPNYSPTIPLHFLDTSSTIPFLDSFFPSTLPKGKVEEESKNKMRTKLGPA